MQPVQQLDNLLTNWIKTMAKRVITITSPHPSNLEIDELISEARKTGKQVALRKADIIEATKKVRGSKRK
jgi:hypothetical protein